MDGIAYLAAAAEAEEEPEIDNGSGSVNDEGIENDDKGRPLFFGYYDDNDRIKNDYDHQYSFYSSAGSSSSPSSSSSSSSSSFPEVPRVWELTSNSTKYDTLRAAPSDNTLIVMWSIWSVIAFLTSLIIIAVFYGILKSILRKRNRRRKELPTSLARRPQSQLQQQQQQQPQHATITRRSTTSTKTSINPFNIYLLFSIFSDLLLVSMFGISCIINAILTSTGSGGTTPLLLHLQNIACNFQSWYVVFCISSSTWITAIIAYQLHTMLRSTLLFVRKQYVIPTTSKVINQCILVYFCSTLLATFGTISTNNQNDDSWWNHIVYETNSIHGLICVPVPNYDDIYNTIFFYCIFLPLLCGIPIIYCTYVCYDVLVHRKHILLPSNVGSSSNTNTNSIKKRQRLFTVYLYRIVGSIIIMWIPAITLLWIVGGTIRSPWASCKYLVLFRLFRFALEQPNVFTHTTSFSSPSVDASFRGWWIVDVIARRCISWAKFAETRSP